MMRDELSIEEQKEMKKSIIIDWSDQIQDKIKPIDDDSVEDMGNDIQEGAI